MQQKFDDSIWQNTGIYVSVIRNLQAGCPELIKLLWYISKDSHLFKLLVPLSQTCVLCSLPFLLFYALDIEPVSEG